MTAGCGVQVVLDGSDQQAPDTNQAADATFERLGQALNGHAGAPSFAMQCTWRASPKTPTASTTTSSWRCRLPANQWWSSVLTNQRFAGSGRHRLERSRRQQRQPELYGASGLLQRLGRGGRADNDYNATRPPVTSGKFTPYYFPHRRHRLGVAGAVDCSVPPATTVNVMASPTSRAQRCTQPGQQDGRGRLRGPGDRAHRPHHPVSSATPAPARRGCG